MKEYEKTVTLKNDAPSEIANFQRKGAIFKRAFMKMKILNFIFYIIDHSTCDQLLPYLKQN